LKLAIIEAIEGSEKGLTNLEIKAQIAKIEDVSKALTKADLYQKIDMLIKSADPGAICF